MLYEFLRPARDRPARFGLGHQAVARLTADGTLRSRRDVPAAVGLGFSGLFFAASVLLAGIGIANLRAAARLDGLRHAIAPVPARMFVGDRPRGSNEVLTFDLQNSSGRTIRVVGSIKRCLAQSCLIAQGLPVVIPGRSTRPVRVRLICTATGPFENSLELFTDNEKQPKIVLGVSGQIVAAERR